MTIYSMASTFLTLLQRCDIFQAVRLIENAEDKQTLIFTLSDFFSLYVNDQNDIVSCQKTQARLELTTKEPFAVQRNAFLKSYLRPYALFPVALLSKMMVFDDDEVRSIAESFFLKVHSVFAFEPLIDFARTSFEHSGGKFAWTILRTSMEKMLYELVDTTLGPDAWLLDALEETTPTACCERIVGWFVSYSSILEAQKATPNSGCEISTFLSKWIRFVIDRYALKSEAALLVTFLGVGLRRFINRGYGEAIVSILISEWRLRLQTKLSFVEIVKSIQDPFAEQRLFQILLRSLMEHEKEEAFSILKAFSCDSTQRVDSKIDALLFEHMIQKERLSIPSILLLVRLLTEHSNKTSDVVRRIGKTWGDSWAIHHLPLPEQAHLTFLLTSLIPFLPCGFAEIGDSELTSLLFEGISNRLGNALETIRFQGMRVAHTISIQQIERDPLFTNLEIDFQTLQIEEQWEMPKPKTPNPEPVPLQKDAEKDSDDESDFCSSVSDEDLEPLPETTSVRILMNEERPVTLNDLHQDLKKAEEPLKVISALKRLSVLIKENPTELASMASELGKTLVYVVLPEWIHEELKNEDAMELQGLKSPSAVRVHCLSSLLTESPFHSGDTIVSLIASKQVAEYQRLEILESLRVAATNLSNPKNPKPENTMLETPSGASKTRIWGIRSLALSKNASHWRNRFVDVVGSWTSSLLLSCRSSPNRFDIMERDSTVLGAVLVTLGSFAEAASGSIVSTSVALTSFPLIQTVLQQKNENCFLRRCSFQVLTSLVQNIPPTRLLSAMRFQNRFQFKDETDAMLFEMVSWTEAQSLKAVSSDSDETCRWMANRCLQVCVHASKASLEADPDPSVLNRSSQTIEFKIPKDSVRLDLDIL